MNTKAIAIIAVGVLLIAGIAVVMTMPKGESSSAVIIDVNPSIELIFDANGNITDIRADEDIRQAIIDATGGNYSSVSYVASAIADVLIGKGYLSSDNNSVLVSTLDSKTYGVAEDVSEFIGERMKSKSIEPAILLQKTNGNKDTDSISNDYGISKGKAALIKEIAAKDELQAVNNFTGKNINELNLIISSGNIAVDDVVSSGTPSEKKYIGNENAKTIVASDLGVSYNLFKNVSVEMDVDNGIMVYDVEFTYNDLAYEYSIEAVNGTILDSTFEKSNDPTPTPGNIITSDRARQIAYGRAGIASQLVISVDTDLERDNGTYVYDIDFTTADAIYDCEVNAVSGDIVLFEKKSAGTITPSEIPAITESKARDIALERAGLSYSDLISYDIDLKRGDTMIYEIEFDTADAEYDCDMNATTGDIISWNKDTEDGSATDVTVGSDKAITVALADAGLSISQITDLDTDSDDSIHGAIYDIDFISNGVKYHYEILSKDGTIVGKESKSVGDGTVPESSKTAEQIKAIAYSHAGVNISQVIHSNIEYDCDDGKCVYELDFSTSSNEYEYVVNGISGEIISSYVSSRVLPVTEDDKVTEKEAQNIALTNAGAPSGTTIRESTLKTDNGRAVYEITFVNDGHVFEYEIDVLTGSILSAESKTVVTPASDVIGENKALQIALADANVSSSEIKSYSVDLTDEDQQVYDIDFEITGASYEYYIGAADGKILWKSQQIHESSGEPAITKDRAITISLNDAGLTKSQVTDLRADIDESDLGSVYEVEFDCNGVEYEYIIDSESGSIIAKETSNANDD